MLRFHFFIPARERLNMFEFEVVVYCKVHRISFKSILHYVVLCVKSVHSK